MPVVVLAVVVLVAGAGLSLLCGPDGVAWPASELVALRGSRVVLAVVTGAALSAAGAALQALLRNPLADPFVTGVSGGAAMGAAVVHGAAALLGLSLGALTTSFGAILGASCASALLLWYARREAATGQGVMGGAILIGVVVNAFSWAVVSVVRVVLPAGEAQRLSVWLIGSVSYPEPQTLLVMTIVVVIAVVVLVGTRHALVLLQGGDDDARRLGVDVERTAFIVVAGATVLTAAATAVTGVVGFIGLLVPHAARRLLGTDVGSAVLVSALCGGGLLALLDGVSRAGFVVVGSELPVGAVCALLGAPVLAVVLVRELRGLK